MACRRSAPLSLLSVLLAGAALADPLDTDLYARVLDRHTAHVGEPPRVHVDYRSLRDDAAWQQLVAELARVDPATLRSREERLAFWINAYNVLAIDTIVRNYPVKSIRDAGSLFFPVWYREAGRIGGEAVTLDGIEHRILRPLGDPRIHAAVVCASRSCPSLRREPYHAETIDAELDDSVARFLADPRKGLAIERDARRVRLSRVFEWFEEDFAAQGGVLAFVARSAPPDAREWLRANGGEVEIEHFDYDWRLNGR
jgi:hypothetical protein